MNGSEKVAVFVIGIIGLTIVGIFYCSTSYWRHHNEQIVQLVKAGTNPVAAMCAMQDDYGKNPVCIVLATKQQ